MDNLVIKSKKKGDGQKIIKLFKSWGVSTGHLDGTGCAENKDMFIYYGVISGVFICYDLEEVQQANATILRLPKEKKVKYPKSIEDVKGRNYYVNQHSQIVSTQFDSKINVSSEYMCAGLHAISQLKEMMDMCNKIDSGTTEFFNSEKRFAILRDLVSEITCTITGYSHPLQFKKESTAKWFLKQHKELIQTAKDFI